MNRRSEEQSGRDQEEKVKVRHTITAEETFTLAKDVFDVRCFLKNIYANRAVIARRLNLLSLSVSAVFTLLYAAYLVFGGLFGKLGLGLEITVGVLFGVYFALLLAVVIVTLCSRGIGTGSVRKISALLKIFRLCIRLLSLAISIAALSLAASGGEYAAPNLAVQVLIILFSVLMLILQGIPLLFGGGMKLVRWLLSPVKTKFRFSSVILEWYELAVTGVPYNKSGGKIPEKYFDDIGRITDNLLLPALGKKYINMIRPAALLAVVDRVPEEDRLLTEGILKSVFSYATACGYVNIDPCKDLNFEGSVEEEVKQKKTVKDRLVGIGKKIGKNVLDKYIASTTDENER